MIFDFTAQPAVFLARPNRYRVHAQLSTGELIAAHCADPGRLTELLLPNVRIHVSPAAPRRNALPRKTAWDLRFVEHPDNGRLISLDTRLPNALFAEGLAAGFFSDIVDDAAQVDVRREVPLPHVHFAQRTAATPRSRADFRLTDGAGVHTWIEIKSASLVVDGTARFPDAVTARGRRHALELAALARAGVRAAIVFIVQRPDADAMEAHRATDPAFADALDDAHAAGVLICAATCLVTTQAITLDRRIPVHTGNRHS